MEIDERDIINPEDIYDPLPITPVFPTAPKNRNWYSINTGTGTKRCFNENDVIHFGFKEWVDQYEDLKENSEGSGSCQDCSMCISTQFCPTISQDNEYYKLVICNIHLENDLSKS